MLRNCLHTRIATLAGLLLALLAGRIWAEESGYGIVRAVDDLELIIHMPAGPLLRPGGMLAVYGPGSVQRHPLTNQVLVENRQLRAKAIITGSQPTALTARILWQEGPVEEGDDAVLIDAPRPRGAPFQAEEPLQVRLLNASAADDAIDPAAIPAQSTVAIELPVRDPDADPLYFRWRLEGTHSGTLHQNSSTQARVLWTSPALEGQEVHLIGEGINPWGQRISLREILGTTARLDSWRERRASLGHRQDNSLPGMIQGIKLRDGRSLMLGNNGTIYVRHAWSATQPFPFAEGQAPRRPIALHALADGGFLVLNNSPAQAIRYSAEGKQELRYEGMRDPRSIIELADGSILVSDPGADGVHCFAADGRYLARLGRSGEGGSPSLLAAHPDGRFLVLQGSSTVQEYDPWWRPLQRISLSITGGNAVVGMAYRYDKHLILLFENGEIRLLNQQGDLVDSLPIGRDHPLRESRSPARSLLAHLDGSMSIFFPGSSQILHVNADGSSAGMEGPLPEHGGVFGSRATRAAAHDQHRFLIDADTMQLQRWSHDGRLIDLHALPEGLREASALAISPDGQRLAILDGRATRIHLLDSNTAQPLHAMGEGGRNPGQLRAPVALALDAAGRVYVLDRDQGKVVVFSENGRFLFEFGQPGREAHQLRRPELLAVTGDGSQAFVVDSADLRVKMFRLDQEHRQGQHLLSLGERGNDPGQLRSPIAIATDRNGLLYLADDNRNDIQVWDVSRGSPDVLHRIREQDLGVNRLENMAVSWDGLILVLSNNALALHYW